MRISEIVSMIKSNFLVALIIILSLSIFFFIGYGIYKKKYNGSKKLDEGKTFRISLLLGYMLIVIVATLINRQNDGMRNVNLHIFSSYVEAWNSWSLRAWQYQVLNILMFLPFGFLLPLVSDRFKSFKNTALASLCFTVFIESMQFITNRGIFELDDILNNFIGGILGYTIAMAFIYLFKDKKVKKGLAYFLPTILILASFAMVVNVYNNKEFGNLYTDPDYTMNMKNIEVVTKLDFNKDREDFKIYKVNGLTKEESLDFAKEYLGKFGVEDLHINEYRTETYYSADDYSLWVDELKSSYEFTDFSRFDNDFNSDPDSDIEVLEEVEARKKVEDFDENVYIPDEARYELEGKDGLFIVENLEKENKLINGLLRFTYFKDGKIKSLENNIVTYDEYSSNNLPTVKSEYEAYQEILDGRFNIYDKNPRKIEIIEVRDSYVLDSKGFYQPVFEFVTITNDDKMVYDSIYVRKYKNKLSRI